MKAMFSDRECFKSDAGVEGINASRADCKQYIVYSGSFTALMRRRLTNHGRSTFGG